MTQAQQILAHLETGRTLTPLDALKLFGCMRLAARIRELRQEGHDITVDRHELKSGATVAKYRLRMARQSELPLI